MCIPLLYGTDDPDLSAIGAAAMDRAERVVERFVELPLEHQWPTLAPRESVGTAVGPLSGLRSEGHSRPTDSR